MIVRKFICGSCNYSGYFSAGEQVKGKSCHSYGCPSCKKVVTYCGSNWVKAEDIGKCLECGGSLINYPKQLKKNFDIQKDKLVCPRCGKKELEIILVWPKTIAKSKDETNK
jgi:hypothetical protein